MLVLVWLWGVLDDAVVVARERWWDGRERREEGGREGGREGKSAHRSYHTNFTPTSAFFFSEYLGGV